MFLLNYLTRFISKFSPYFDNIFLLLRRLAGFISRPLSSTNRYTIVSSGSNRVDAEFSRQPQKVVVVLGMHRSGTSLLTGTLQEAGLVLGDVVTSAPHNRKGNREALPIRALHDDLLQRSGGAWNQPPSQVVWEPIHLAFRDVVVDGYRDEACWGFKDPRSLFCLEGWLDAVPQLQPVAIVRHPEAVARSLQARERMQLDDGLELWRIYNLKLLYWMQRMNIPLLHFGSDLDLFCGHAAALIHELDLPNRLSSKSLRFPDPKLHHQSSSGLPLPPDIEDLYCDLLGRSMHD